MSDWSEEDSITYREIAAVAVPRRAELMAALIAHVPFNSTRTFRAVDLGCGDGILAEVLLEQFPGATLLGLDGSRSMRASAVARTGRFGDRVQILGFDLASLDWWDRLVGADLVLSTMALHHLNDAKKQYLFKAVADRLPAGGAFLMADLIAPATDAARLKAADEWDRSARAQAEFLAAPALYVRFIEAEWNAHRFPQPLDYPAALLHHLVWLKHAGFAAVDCLWMFAGHAVFGGFK